jgi:CDP-diacylglycerol--glycerol-3-phosphate 3-phosphatidyltransferase
MSEDKNKNQIVLAPYDYIIKLILPIIPTQLKPNHVTFIRLVGTPFLILFLLDKQYLYSIVLFIFLAITDILDGSMARLRNQITDWGKIWDPIADKLLIGSVIVILLFQLNFSLAIMMLSFEAAFILGGALYKMTASEHAQLQANVWGKIKMNLQCFGVILLILGYAISFQPLVNIAEILFYISLFFAALSLVTRGI